MREQGAAGARLLMAACFAVCAALAGPGAAQEPAEPGAGAAAAPAPAPPIHISADAAEYFNKEGRVVFTGNVVANQGDTTLTSQRMEVTFSQPPGGGGGGGAGAIGAPAAERKITQIVALERVTFRQVDPDTKKERFATGEKGVYDAAERVVTMTGNPRLWEGKNVIVGEEIRMRLDDKNMNVRGKVNLTVYPDEAKEEKRP